jgi:hypothetical protein
LIKCFDVLLEHTAYILRVNKLVQMDAQVMRRKEMCLVVWEGLRASGQSQGPKAKKTGLLTSKRILLRVVIPLPELVEISVLDLRHIL